MRIGVATKFQLRLTILMFWAEFAQKGCFWSKTENSHLCMCPWSFLPILNLFAGGAKDRVKARRRVRRVLIMGKACRRVSMMGKTQGRARCTI